MKNKLGPFHQSHNPVTTDLSCSVVETETGSTICSFPDPRYANERNKIKSQSETIAIAKLFASAPEMLEALHEIAQAGHDGCLYPEEALKKLRLTANVAMRIIAKAEGES
jgi:hypothetical protein